MPACAASAWLVIACSARVCQARRRGDRQRLELAVMDALAAADRASQPCDEVARERVDDGDLDAEPAVDDRRARILGLVEQRRGPLRQVDDRLRAGPASPPAWRDPRCSRPVAASASAGI